MNRMRRILSTVAVLTLAACQSFPQQSAHAPAPAEDPAKQLLVLNRVTWGANTTSARDIAALGTERWLEQQLKPPARPVLPAEVQARIDSMTITQKPLAEIAMAVEQQRRDMVAIRDPAEQKVAR